MKRILNAIAEYIEARAELVREEAATIGLLTFSRAYKEGQDDLLGCDCETTNDCG